jgi:hypothetical protein
MSTLTTNLQIVKPVDNDPAWGTTCNTTFDLIDGLTPIGSLFVSKTETPSTSLNVRVTGGSYQKSNGQIGTYAGSGSFGLTASITNFLWLTDAGILTAGTAFPTGLHVRLATILASTATITSVTDARLAAATSGASRTISSQTITTTYTALPTDGNLRLDATAGIFTVTLPSASSVPGLVLRCIKIDAVATVTISSASLINGSGSTTLTTQYQAKTFVADGTANVWNVF